MQLIEDVFSKNNIDFISMNENFDTGTPFGRAMIGILSVFAQLERDQIKERLTMGRIGRAKTGHWNGGQKPPVGYEYKEGQLIPIEYIRMQGCPAKGYKKELIEDVVIKEIKKLALNPSEIDRLYANSQPNVENNTAILEKRISELDSQLEKLLDLYQLGNIDISKISNRINDINTEKDKLVTELNEKKIPLPALGLEETHKIITNFETVFQKGSPEVQQSLVRSLIKKIIVNDDGFDFYWNFCI